MLNIEELAALADGAGFDMTVGRPPDAADVAAHFSSGPVTWPDKVFSVCVAAPQYDLNDRYRPFNSKDDDVDRLIERNLGLLRAAACSLSQDGLMFVYGLPHHLPRYATALSSNLVFRYWIAVRTMTAAKAIGLRPEHTGLLLLSKPGASLNRIRVPHAMCRYCGKALKDWGGKSHLMHPGGVAVSDVWMDLVVDPRIRMPSEVFDRILQLSYGGNRARLLLVAPDDTAPVAAGYDNDRARIYAFDPFKWRGPRGAAAAGRSAPGELVDRLHNAPCLDVLRTIPSETVDLAFADPPFNLTKNYNGYSDDRGDSDYIGWCKRWLVEYERVLKPGGALFTLNLPKWSVWLADFLSRTNTLYLQNWIVWNSLPEPKGVIMPAHYSLLYFTKGARPARFNYCSMENGWEPFDEAVFPPDRADVCQRRQCVRKRRASGETWRGELTDIWHDIHRVRQPISESHRRRAHPCATPERLIDRIIRLSTNPGDLVLDAFAGVGTTALIAKRLGRRFIAIEQDGSYLRVAENKISEQGLPLQRGRILRKQRGVSRRALQLELQNLARRLGRLPTKADVEMFSKYELHAFESSFTSWSRALKAAAAVVNSPSGAGCEAPARDQLELFNLGRNNSDTGLIKLPEVAQGFPKMEKPEGGEDRKEMSNPDSREW